MSRFPLEETENKVGSKYSAVVAIAKRAFRTSQTVSDIPVGSAADRLRSAMEEILTGRLRVTRAEESSKGERGTEEQEEE